MSKVILAVLVLTIGITFTSCSESDSNKNLQAIHFGPGPSGYQDDDATIAEAP